MTQGEDTDAAIPWIPAFCRAGLAALSLASAEGGEADALRRIVTGPFAVGVATRANDVLWLAIELASSTGFVTIAHGEAFVELPPETVKPIRAALAPAAFSFFAEVRALRGAGRLSVVRHRGWNGGAAVDAAALASLCAGPPPHPDCVELTAWLSDARNTEVLVACLTLLMWAEFERLTELEGEPPLAALPKAVGAALLGLSRALAVLDVLDHTSEVRTRPSTEPRGVAMASAPVTPEGAQPRSHEDLQFTVFKRKVVLPDRWSPLLAFAHPAENAPDARPGAPSPAERVRRDAESALGAEMRNFEHRVEDALVAVPREGEVTFQPAFQHVEFIPPVQTFLWTGEIHRAEFSMRPRPQCAGKVVKGQLRVLWGPLLLAELNLSMRVAKSAEESVADTLEASETCRAYRKIFASYSHKDAEIVRQLTRYAHLTGDRYLFDHAELRAGEIWSERLKQLIDEATIFQLFWSSNSMISPFVRREWEYALSLGRTGFIRPAYWETPFPETAEPELPPLDLRALHFVPIGTQQPPPPSQGKSTAGAAALVTSAAAVVVAFQTGAMDHRWSAPEQLKQAASRVDDSTARLVIVPPTTPRELLPGGTDSVQVAPPELHPAKIPEIGTNGSMTALFLVIGAWLVLAGRHTARAH